MKTELPPSTARVLAPNLAAFVIGLVLAWFLRWETTDLVWSLWLSSLVIGYATILIRLGYGSVLGWKAIHDDRVSASQRRTLLFIGIGFALFLLVFFSLHFCGFHAGHSVFLNSFFPLDGLPEEGFIRAFMNPLLLWKLVFQYLMIPYGLFIIPTVIAERKAIFKPFREALPDSAGDIETGGKRLQHDLLKDIFAGPYKNVVRMHLLIFFFAGCHFLKIESFLVYVVVSAVYFLPWKELKELSLFSKKPPEN
ncbi:MAG: DUF6498-containing protein [Verrucomicrobiales bacterium]|nr:DUF6498-containing protein [Verrucomicrobiales bacterium]